jgi:hypothetical protein
MNRKYWIIFTLVSIGILLLLYLFMPDTLLQIPEISPAAYLVSIPYTNILGTNIVLIKPSSTFFIYFLGIQTILLGFSFLKTNNQPTYYWWGIAMLFWGIGAVFAGTSYQGFGYELKCVGNEYCLHTSWFELTYYYFTALSMGALGVAIAYTILPENKRKFLFSYASVAVAIYIVLFVVGVIIENRFLISYELFTIFFMPLYIIFFIYSVILYKNNRDTLNYTLIITWLLFLVVNVSYYVYYFLGFGEALYQNTGIWFSANDVLHVLLIIWMGFIQFRLKRVIDLHHLPMT